VTFFKRLAKPVGVVVAVSAIVGSAACGGGDSNANGQPTVPLQNSGGTTPTPTQEIEVVVIKVTDNAFDPAEVTVPSGGTVRWEWEGTNPHSIQLAGVTSTEQTSGTFERQFTQTGVSFPYQCGVHKGEMAGRILVQ
jgi:plastocyanin